MRITVDEEKLRAVCTEAVSGCASDLPCVKWDRYAGCKHITDETEECVKRLLAALKAE